MMKTLKLNDEQLGVVISGLGELPLKIASGTFNEIMKQVNNTASDLVEEARAKKRKK